MGGLNYSSLSHNEIPSGASSVIFGTLTGGLNTIHSSHTWNIDICHGKENFLLRGGGVPWHKASGQVVRMLSRSSVINRGSKCPHPDLMATTNSMWMLIKNNAGPGSAKHFITYFHRIES